MKSPTDLNILKATGTTLMGNGHVDEGIALEAAVAELQGLREIVASTKPVCPHCKTEMRPVKYEGYYDSFTYWSCDCDVLPEIEQTWKGGYV